MPEASRGAAPEPLRRGGPRPRGMCRALLVGLAFSLGTACAGLPSAPPLVPGEVVEMAQGGVPAEEIVARMRAGGGVYRLRASELARLRDQGVPDEVIDYMQGTWLEQVRRETWLEERARAGPGLYCCDGLLRR
jgi:hypothetical protein